MVEYLLKVTQLVSGGTNSVSLVPESMFLTTVPFCRRLRNIENKRWAILKEVVCCKVHNDTTPYQLGDVKSFNSLVPAPSSAEDCCPAV